MWPPERSIPWISISIPWNRRSTPWKIASKATFRRKNEVETCHIVAKSSFLGLFAAVLRTDVSERQVLLIFAYLRATAQARENIRFSVLKNSGAAPIRGRPLPLPDGHSPHPDGHSPQPDGHSPQPNGHVESREKYAPTLGTQPRRRGRRHRKGRMPPTSIFTPNLYLLLPTYKHNWQPHSIRSSQKNAQSWPHSDKKRISL